MPKKAIEIIRSAYATSRHNEAGRLADESGELLDVLNSSIREYFAEGAKVNRRFFGDLFEVGFDAGRGGWPRPERAEMIVLLEAGSGMTSTGGAIALGTGIADVPLDQRHVEPAKPAVYSFGQLWRSRGTAVDPNDGSLNVYASVSPAPLTDLEEELDALWPSSSNSLLKWDLAIYLAVKDGERDAELAAFARQQERDYARFIDFLEHESITETRSYGHSGRFTSPRVTPRG
jgi:hypothetical protein